MRNPLTQRQSDAGSGIVVMRVQPLEQSKNPFLLRSRDSDTIIADRHFHLAIIDVPCGLDMQNAGAVWRPKLQPVGDQVLQQAAHLRRKASYHRKRSDMYLRLRRVDVGTQIRQHLFAELRQIDCLEPRLQPNQLRITQGISDDPGHACGCRARRRDP